MDAEPNDAIPSTLLTGFADALWRMDENGRVTAGAPTGLGPETAAHWKGRLWLEAVDPADRALAESLWHEASAARGALDASLRLRLDGGAAEPAQLRIVPAGEHDWHGIARRRPDGEGDVHRRLIETIDDGFCTIQMIYDADGQPVNYRFLAVNSAFERQSGFRDAVGRTARELVPDLPRKWLDVYDRITRSGTAERFEEQQEKPRRFFEIYATPIEGPGGSRLAVLFRDVLPRRRAEAELSRSERRLSTLVQSMPQFVWRATAAGRWTWASSQWGAYTGQSGADSRGLGWLRMIHPDDRGRVAAAWAKARERGEFQVEIRIRPAGGEGYRWFHARALPVRDEAGATREWVGTCTDIDEMRQLQARQEVLLAELQHRTRNLLGVVTSVAERTARSARSVADFLPRFRERLLALSRINGLLSQLDRGQRVTFDELIRAELGARGVLDEGGERVVLDGPLGVRLRSATVQTFALAIHELATNAVKYGALSGDAGRLAVRWRLGEPEGGPRRLCVEWIESGTAPPPPVPAAPGRGYGRELIEKALPYQMKARTRYEIGPEGVRCTIDVPVD
ncbi:sensor histidine kinase [Aureimonas sp. SK2]|uniref:sensor histidine kinase n=1 Tax=Aureimonas sp. SK2 TaxID=3015992 RepID=UPI002444087C|nr:PAS domain-containing protein [Aureimonas sp. SK2]